MAKPISPSKQLLIELVGSPHWDQLVKEAETYAQYLRSLALDPAKTEMDFYAKEGAARAARELETFFASVEHSVQDVVSPKYD